MQELYFDYYLKGKGQPFGHVKAAVRNGNAEITVRLPEGVAADSVMLYYSEASVKWQQRKWTAVPAQRAGERYLAALPEGPGINWFAYVRDSRGVAVASGMYGVE